MDVDLAELYGVPTKRLNEQLRRNIDRFPDDFLFNLTAEELDSLNPELEFPNEPPKGRGGRRHPPTAFTEHGAIMAATILNSPRAVQMSVYVVRAFVKRNSRLDGGGTLLGTMGLAAAAVGLARLYGGE